VTGKDDQPTELTTTPAPAQEPTPTAAVPTPVERDQSATGA